MSVMSIRVVETIPGKSCMGLEVPNPQRQSVGLIEILGSAAYNDASSLLTMSLGKDIAGRPVVADLGRMPHCLVAGTLSLIHIFSYVHAVRGASIGKKGKVCRAL